MTRLDHETTERGCEICSSNVVQRATLPACVLVLLVSLGCDQQSRTPPSEPDHLSELELAPSNSIVDANLQLPTIWVTGKAVVLGSRVLTTLQGDPLEIDDLSVVERSLVRVQVAERGYALGIDRNTPFYIAREFMKAGLVAGSETLELRVGDRGTSKAIKICAAGGREAQKRERDCWGRTLKGPSRPPDRHTVGEEGTAGVEKILPGDIADVPPSFSLDDDLELTLSIHERHLLVSIQGQSLRSLPMETGPQGSPDEGELRYLSPTLESLRRSNRWDRRAAIRVMDAVRWEQLVAVFDPLVAANFDHITVVDISQER